jgi:hypothetical protein
VIQEISAPSTNRADILISQAVSLGKKRKTACGLEQHFLKISYSFFDAASQW